MGDINGDSGGILVIRHGNITSVGNVNGGDFAGIYLGGNGDISSTGNVTSNDYGIIQYGTGKLNIIGDVTAGNMGIYGGDGDQNVQLRGTIDAPVAVRLNGGNDTFYIHNSSEVYGAVELGDGDDIVVIGDNAVVTDTVLGGETGEVFGDSLYIGDGTICTDNAVAVAAAQAINGLNPDTGTVTYLGQTYTWAEFEYIASGAQLDPCMPGQIHDGRINSYDLGAPVALYCTVGGGVSVWGIDLTGQGTFSFAVTHDEIEAGFTAAVATGVNQLLRADARGNSLYALSDGSTITFAGPDLREPWKTYVFTLERSLCA